MKCSHVVQFGTVLYGTRLGSGRMDVIMIQSIIAVMQVSGGATVDDESGNCEC